MAKTFKKAIALLISVLMIVTTLPLSAISAQAATGADVDTSSVTDATTKYPSVSIDGGSGVGYASDFKINGYVSHQGGSSKNYQRQSHGIVTKDIVWIYDGSEQVFTAPVIFTYSYSNSNSSQDKKRGVNYVENTNTTAFALNYSKWVGKLDTSDENNGDNPYNYSYNLNASTYSFDISSSDTTEFLFTQKNMGSNRDYFSFSNALKFVGSVPETYEKYSYGFKSYDQDKNQFSEITSTTTTGIFSGNSATHGNDTYAYMINVTALEKALDNAKKAVQSKNHYTSESVQALVDAVSNAKLDYSSADLSTEENVKAMSDQVQNTAKSINEAIMSDEDIEHTYDASAGVHTDATLEQKGYTTYKCSVCNEDVVVYDENDWTTYDSTVAEYESIISASDYAKKYTDSSKAEYEATVENAKLDKNSDSVTQVAINNAIATILEAKAVLEEKQGLTVTVNVVADDNADIDVDAITDLVYGDTATVDLTDALAGYTITKWTIVQDNATSKLAMADKVYEMVVTGDTDITVYVSKTPEDTTNYKKVVVIDRNEKKLGTAYIEKAENVDLTSDVIAGIEAPSLAFYEFKAWEVLTDTDNSIMVKATYTAPGASCNVHFLDGLTFNGVSEYEAYYDETLSVDTDAKLAIATKEDRSDAVAITNNNSIHTPKANDAYIFIVNDTTTLASTAITGVYYTNSTASFNAIYSLPEGAELVECGAYVTRSTEDNTSGFNFDLADAFKVRSQSQSSNGEYTISVPSSNGFAGYKTVYAKSYVVYVLDGQQITQTSDAVGITVN